MGVSHINQAAAIMFEGLELDETLKFVKMPQQDAAKAQLMFCGCYVQYVPILKEATFQIHP